MIDKRLVLLDLAAFATLGLASLLQKAFTLGVSLLPDILTEIVVNVFTKQVSYDSNDVLV